jgi:hypothetical protein
VDECLAIHSGNPFHVLVLLCQLECRCRAVCCLRAQPAGSDRCGDYPCLRNTFRTLAHTRRMIALGAGVWKKRSGYCGNWALQPASRHLGNVPAMYASVQTPAGKTVTV